VVKADFLIPSINSSAFIVHSVPFSENVILQSFASIFSSLLAWEEKRLIASSRKLSGFE
jgi:hypothetical protein